MILTLGSQGAVILSAGEATRVPAVPIDGPVDPTGAGDMFLMAYGLARLRGDDPARRRARRQSIRVDDHRPMSGLLVSCALGVVSLDLDDGEITLLDDDLPARGEPPSSDCRCWSPPIASALGSSRWSTATAAARLQRRAGSRGASSAAGCRPGVDVAIDPDSPDTIAYSTDERIYLSRSGGVFWEALETELPEIAAISWGR